MPRLQSGFPNSIPNKVTAVQIVSIIPLAVVHTLGNLLTNVSLGKVAVSFTHTIKVCDILYYFHTYREPDIPYHQVILKYMFPHQSHRVYFSSCLRSFDKPPPPR